LTPSLVERGTCRSAVVFLLTGKEIVHSKWRDFLRQLGTLEAGKVADVILVDGQVHQDIQKLLVDTIPSFVY
jgi:hypothetical protein